MGKALHRRFPELDYVVTGEGEVALVQLLEALGGRREISDVENLTWRDENQNSRSSKEAATTDISRLAPPDFDSYFARFYSSPISESVEPSLVLETSRGCWWGQKHHCTFCGLNGQTMAYRMKEAPTFLTELKELVAKHQVLDVIMADNIIAMESFDNLLPALKDSELDLRLQFEIKANLNADQIKMLADSKVISVQPGIESLSSNILKLMEKGVTGAQNVYLLREMERNNITVFWNLLAGFPGELKADYVQMRASLPDLTHLQPPTGMARILLQRFSPFFDKPWLGFKKRNTAPCYAIIYDLDEEALTDMVYMFETEALGIDEDTIREFNDFIEQWRQAYRIDSELNHRIEGGIVHIRDRRPGRNTEYTLDAVNESLVYLELDRPSRIPGLMHRLRELGLEMERPVLMEMLARFKERGLIFVEDGWYVLLSIGSQMRRFRQVHCVAEVSAAARDLEVRYA